MKPTSSALMSTRKQYSQMNVIKPSSRPAYKYSVSAFLRENHLHRRTSVKIVSDHSLKRTTSNNNPPMRPPPRAPATVLLQHASLRDPIAHRRQGTDLSGDHASRDVHLFKIVHAADCCSWILSTDPPPRRRTTDPRRTPPGREGGRGARGAAQRV